jgi:hypothetical protein
MLHEGNEITPGISPSALRAALTRVQNHSRRFCQGKSGKQGRTIQIGSQIFPDFVQVQTVIQYFCVKSMKAIDINKFSPEFVTPSCNMQARPGQSDY